MTDLTPRDRLFSRLPSALQRQFAHFAVLERTGSTNADLLALGGRGVAFEMAIEQTDGRGRRERTWHSVPGSSLAFSLAFDLHGSADDIAALPIAVGVACVTGLQRLGFAVALKWPNDLVQTLATGEIHKLGGILVELRAAGPGQWRAVCGIGLNVTAESIANLEIDQPASFLMAVARDPDVDLETIITELLTDLLGTVVSGPATFAPMIEAGRTFDCLLGHDVHVIEPQREWNGTANGWNASGHLQVTDVHGTTQVLRSAEVSIRPRGVTA